MLGVCDGLPVGAIIMWTGTMLPAGWALCDGKETRPDMTKLLKGYVGVVCIVRVN